MKQHMILKFISLLSIAWLVSSCAVATASPTPTATSAPSATPIPPTETPSPPKRELEEYAVYRTILDSGKERCIHNKTLTVTSIPGPLEIGLESLRELDYKLRNDYNQGIQESVTLDPDLLNGSVMLLSGYDNWPCMFIHGFSRVGFNSRMDEALVYHENKGSPWAEGEGELIYLVKGADGSWKIEWRELIWIS